MFRGIRRASFFQRRQPCQPRGVYPSAPRYEMLGSDLRAFRQAGYFLRRDLPLGGKRRVAVSEARGGAFRHCAVRGGAFLSVGAFLAGNAVLRRRKRRGLHAAGIRQGCLAEDRRDIPAACGLLPQEHVYHAHGGMRPGNAADRTHPGAPGFLRTLPAAQTNSFMFPVRLVW